MAPSGRTAPRNDITAVIITLNEAENLGPCLEALTQTVREVLVLDSHSTDPTCEVARSYGAKVHSIDWQGYAATKNIGNQLSSNEWILSIDADEVLSPELIENIQSLELEDNTVYVLDRLTNFDGKWIRYSGWYPDWKPRLFQRSRLSWQGDYVHETLHIPEDVKRVRLKGKLWHYSYKSLEDHLARTEKYARLSAEKMHAAGRKVSRLKEWLAPPARFFRTYFLKGGILDGRLGYIISLRDAWLVRRKYRYLREMK
jgi:glycosyltransferase involved in cell wall biosynthesis